MHPTRRRCLRRIGGPLLLTGLAGCTGDGPGGADGDGEDSATPTGTSGELPPDTNGTGTCGDGTSGTRPAGTGGPGVTLVSVDACPALPVRPAVEVVREAATPEHPPRLRTRLTSTADEPVRVGEGRAVHFEHVTDDSGALVLLPGDGEYPATPDCWRLHEGIATTEEYRTFEIEPGESSSRPVDLYATPGGDGCLPVGEHRFETTISVVSEAAEPESSARWGFSILLE
ncbi:hypothetical protein [Haloplanus rubicundus]|uniref:Uncharacterized protein n=1 Tax=Haloplanus rubicundus TaxID=1547898 RepID=A0A345EF71_9EURY|nr:hypothetical protein [Haloplanus rubicundus]AXG10843.1 hypothetical protein DU484_13865 [Haloplanus rubicundus]